MNAAGLESPLFPDSKSTADELSLLRLLDYGAHCGRVKHMRDCKIPHSNLKAGNKLLRNGHINITDFGSSRDRKGR